jgi:hypothetical protein
MTRAITLTLLLSVLALLVVVAPASGSGRRLCFANSEAVIMAKNTTCRIAQKVSFKAAKHYPGLHRYSVFVPGLGRWHCNPRINGHNYLDIVCHKGVKVAGIAIKQ